MRSSPNPWLLDGALEKITAIWMSKILTSRDTLGPEGCRWACIKNRNMSSFLFGSLLALSSLSASVYASPFARRNTTEKRYAILDNDWSTVGFIPFLLALGAGIEVLGITSFTANTWH
ncbi:hypothetical protein BDZ45DRAFT_739782 [Acephala macrosclerotiorum]|nr:hypothetical protein BDZ45DRAFT_739782 [Acephala macrosclerotiorum]